MSTSRRIAVVGGHVVDPLLRRVIEADVVVEDGVIIELAPDSIGDAVVVDAEGGWITPGFIDAHFHAFAIDQSGLTLERIAPNYAALAAARRLRGALLRGFTTVRDVAGGDAGFARALRERLVLAPEYVYSGPALSQTGGHGDPREPEIDVPFCGGHLSEIVDGSDAVRRAVRERLRQGATVIKMMTSGGVGSHADPLHVPQYSSDEIRTAVEEAERRGVYVAAHAYSPEAIVHSVRNGVRSIEHGNFLDDDAAGLMAKRGAYLVSTLGAYTAIAAHGERLRLPKWLLTKNADVLASGVESLTVAARNNVPIAFGSDNMGELVSEQLSGIEVHARARDIWDVLGSLTHVNADLLNRPDLGGIAPGKRADLLVHHRDPIADPRVLWMAERPPRVLQGGEPLPSAGTHAE